MGAEGYDPSCYSLDPIRVAGSVSSARGIFHGSQVAGSEQSEAALLCSLESRPGTLLSRRGTA